MQYQDVVKAMFAKYRGQMPAKDIMKLAAAEYRKMGSKTSTKTSTKTRGAGVFGDIGSAADSIGSLFGLGLDEGKGMKKPHKTSAKTRGAGVFGDIGNAADSIGSLFGLGLDEGKGMKKGSGKRMPRGGYLSAGNMDMAGAMTAGKGAFNEVPFNPVALPNQTGGNILQSVSSLLPMMALL